jgi:predicted nucleic acid-binding protein
VRDFPVILDANVLVPMSLRDTLLLAAEVGLYRPHWSDTILDEVRRTLMRLPKLRLPEERAVRLVAKMNEAFPEARIIGYEYLIDGMTNEPEDRHVLAAAVRCGARAIVTLNTKDFPAAALQASGVEAQHPDQFLSMLFTGEQETVLKIVETQAGQTRNPTLTVERVLQNLSLFTPRFVELVRRARTAER